MGMFHKSKISVLLVIIIASSISVLAKQANKRPNIILIMSDDHGWADAGFNGSDVVQTPSLDALAKKGVVFNRFYSASAVCSPTRASVMTGRNPYRTNVPNANAGHLRGGEITIAELLKEQGYACGHFGKWHLGTLTKSVVDANRGGREKFLEEYNIPSAHGYDSYFCTESKVPTCNPMEYPAAFIEGESKKFGWRAVEDNSKTKPYNTRYWVGEDSAVQEELLQGDDSKVVVDRVLPFVESASKDDQPFFTTVWFHTPHLPVVCDSAHRALYSDLDLKKQLYYGAITAMDEQIGRLWKHLEDLDIEEETLIFYCSDNGPEVKTPGSAGDYRARKRSLHEGGLRVPAFVLWPGSIEGGQKSSFPAVTSDYLPTIMEILELSYPDDRPLDGESLVEVMLDKKELRNRPIGFIYNKQISWVDNQYKLISKDKQQTYELYDLQNDASEEVNIIETHKELAEDMKTSLIEWYLSVDNSRKGLDY